MKKDLNLIMVSNAEPYAHFQDGNEIKREKIAGGLTSALDPLMEETGGTWVAWGREDADFEVLDENGIVRVPDEDGYDLKRLKLTGEEVEGFYLGFSNEVMWPICHSFSERSIITDYCDCKENWKTYRKVNRKYADAVLEELDEEKYVWVQDYHLTLVPEMIREEAPETEIAFFWHIPWPPSDLFNIIPWRDDIMDGILSSDFIGFHTSWFKDNFISCAEDLGKEVDYENSAIYSESRKTSVDSLPLGIDYDYFAGFSQEENFESQAQRLRDEMSVEKIILGIDRLDYTKGIPQRLRAFETLLDENPEYEGRVTLIQRIPPSRGRVDEYQSILKRIHRIVGEINGKFGKVDWTPIKSFHRFLPKQRQLIPYYLAADVALVTPLMDGMNLVCKEYVASTDDGVLILSEFAGAAEEMNESIFVNPYDVEETAEGIKRALTMSSDERKERLSKLKDRVRNRDLENWRTQFLNGWLGNSSGEIG